MSYLDLTFLLLWDLFLLIMTSFYLYIFFVYDSVCWHSCTTCKTKLVPSACSRTCLHELTRWNTFCDLNCSCRMFIFSTLMSHCSPKSSSKPLPITQHNAVKFEVVRYVKFNTAQARVQHTHIL